MKKLIPLILFALLAIRASTQITYVKTGGAGDGSSWANASGTLTAVLNAAVLLGDLGSSGYLLSDHLCYLKYQRSKYFL